MPVLDKYRTVRLPEGLVSLSSLNICRQNLGDLGLIEEIMEEGARPRTYLIITDKGRCVAQKIREIQEILEEAAVADGSWLLAKGQDRTRPQELLSIKAFLRTQHEGLKLERTVEFVVSRCCIQYSQDSRTFVPSLNQEGPSNVVYENEEVRARICRTRVAHSCYCLFSSAYERMVWVRGFFYVPYAGR